MLVFDIEADGLLLDASEVHCLVIYDTDTKQLTTYRTRRARTDAPCDGTIEDGLARLQAAESVAGHNVLDYDIPVLQRLYPGWEPPADVLDTLLLSNVLFTDLKDRDFRQHAKKGAAFKLPRKLFGRHSLEAWGYRLGEYKGDFQGPWDEWSMEMEQYCQQDVRVTARLLEALLSRTSLEDEWVGLEHAVRRILTRQTLRGFAFDVAKARALQAQLAGERERLRQELVDFYGSWYVSAKEFVPKRDNATLGYVAGVPLTKVRLVTFNPASRQQIADRLIKVHGWEPQEFTPSGQPKVDETLLAGLDHPMVAKIRRYLLVDKRLGQLAEGDKAWLKLVRDDGRLHGSVICTGTVTGRMAHLDPNLGQVPNMASEYGPECRELFRAGQGYRLVGCDAEGLELRGLAHLLARYDEGNYAHAVVSGRKEDGTDAHSVNRDAIGLRTRDAAKTWFYAFIYGAGDWKLGLIVWMDMDPETRPAYSNETLARLGRRSRQRLASKLPAFDLLLRAVKKAAKKGWLRGLDGRRLHVRAEHAALNTVLQSLGGIVMKRALVRLDERLQELGLRPGHDYEFVANVHDEWQIEVLPEHAERVGQEAAQAIQWAGEFYNLRCPLAGDYAIGQTWRDTH